MAKITYADKEAINIDTSIPAKNKCMADDLNQIKTIVNANTKSLLLELDQWSSSTSYSINRVIAYKNKVYVKKTPTSTTQAPDTDTTNWEEKNISYILEGAKPLPYIYEENVGNYFSINSVLEYNIYTYNDDNKLTIDDKGSELEIYGPCILVVEYRGGISTINVMNQNGSKKYHNFGGSSSTYWEEINDNYEILISYSANPPSTCNQNDKYYNQILNKIFVATATNTWNTEGRTPSEDTFYIVSENNQKNIYIYNGVTLTRVGSSGADGENLPVGSILAFAGSTAPEGYLMCDGSNVSRTTYGELFNVIGTTYGQGDTTTTFGLPNIKGRVLVGLDSTQTEFDTLGETGGSKELQAHSHDVKINNQGGSASGLSFNWTYNNDGVKFYDGTAFLKETGTGNSGNLQPYIVVNYIIKAHPSAVNTSEVVNEHSTSETNVYSCNYVNGELDKKQDIKDYSTSEVDTGMLWIDGKKIYRKVVTGNFNNTPKNHNINNLSMVISIKGFYYNNQTSTPNFFPIPMVRPNFAEYEVGIYVNATQIQFDMGTNIAGHSELTWYVVIEYTKTTD